MLKALKPLIISSFVLVLSFVAIQATSSPVSAQRARTGTPTGTADTGVIQGGLCKGGNDLAFPSGGTLATTGECTKTNASASSLNDLVKNIINIFSVVVGIVAVIMIIIGGFRYITSGGDSGNVTTAKNTILYAIVGLVIVALAQFIVRFVLNKSTGLTT
jgi:hypothetical protein